MIPTTRRRSLDVRRQRAAFHCSGCSFKSEMTAAIVRCDHSGEAKPIALSSGRCPVGNWDHSTPDDPKKTLDISVPRTEWPPTALDAETKRADGDKGVGDTLARLGDPVSKMAMIALTPSTKCADRVAKANALYPYV